MAFVLNSDDLGVIDLLTPLHKKVSNMGLDETWSSLGLELKLKNLLFVTIGLITHSFVRVLVMDCESLRELWIRSGYLLEG